MGSIVGSVGAKFGLSIPIPAATQNIVITSLPPPYPTIANTTIVYAGFEFGWRNFLFQIVPGTATGMSATVFSTLDGASAQGNANNWEQVPVASGTGWSNPMTGTTAERLCFINSGPWCAFLVIVSGAVAGSSSVLFAAGA